MTRQLQLIAVALLTLCGSAAGQVRTWPQAMLEDADLRDVDFADALHGWAVGDRGVIWHTADGGQTWTLQPSGVGHNLRSVDFIDQQHGWAVGGHTLSYLHRGKGIILSTSDGGTNWRVEVNPAIPTLFDVQFTDLQQGTALGARSPLFLGGLFVTNDGGRIWSGHPTARTEDHARWSTDVRLSALRQARQTPAELTFQWNALGESGNRWWVAGTPGTAVYRSDDSGASWQPYETGQTLPIHAMHFVDDDRGWAVGAMGLILSTTDGGATWSGSRGTDHRAAALVICSGQHVIPFGEIAALAAADGYRVHVLVVTQVTTDRPFAVSAEQRLREAVAGVGGHGATWWTEFEVPPSAATADDLLASWHARHSAEGWRVTGVDRLTQRLTAAIRTWRPDVVYFACSAADAITADAPKTLDGLLGVAVEAAVEASAGETYFRPLLTEARLPSWQPAALTRLVNTDQNQVAHAGSRLAISLGASAEELGQQAAELIDDRPVSIQLFQPVAPDGTPRRLTHGMKGGLGTPSRRPAIELAGGNLEQIATRAQRLDQLRAMVDRLTSDQAEVQSTQIIGLVNDLGPTEAARIITRLAAQLEECGAWQAAYESWDLVAKRFGDSDLASFAWLRQWQHVTSAEIQTRLSGPRSQPALTTARRGADVTGDASSVEPASWQQSAADALLQRIPVSLQNDPAIEFIRHRGMAEHRSAQRERIWKRLARSSEAAEWKQCAEGELALWDPAMRDPALSDRTQSAAKPIVSAPLGARPILDGLLNDAIWQTATAITLNSSAAPTSPDAANACCVKIARDEQHLYLAIHADKLAGVSYEPAEGTRQRDADLTLHDRVEFAFDVDRDYQTGWRLEIDHRGWGGERLGHDQGWNPTWYIAATESPTTWTVEAAIPLAELGVDLAADDACDAWGLGIHRHGPPEVAAITSQQAWPPSSQPGQWTQLGYLDIHK